MTRAAPKQPTVISIGPVLGADDFWNGTVISFYGPKGGNAGTRSLAPREVKSLARQLIAVLRAMREEGFEI